MRVIKETQKLKLGDAMASQDNISRSLKRLSLGMPRLASYLSSSTNYRLVSVDPKFLLLHMSCAILAIPFCFVLLAV